MKTALLLLALLTMCILQMDIVRNHYDSRDELMADGGGWLPDFLPGSVRDIRAVIDVDLDTSTGGFEFSDTDAGPFFARLTLGPAPDSPFEHWDEPVRDYRASGYVAWNYREGGRVWTFFCHPVEDECEYLSWDRQRQEKSETPGTTHSDAPASATPIPVAASTSLG